MGCPKRPIKLLWFIPWEAPHKWKLKSIHFCAYWSERWECETCEAREERGYFRDPAMIRKGYDLKKLRSQGYAVYGDRIDECRVDS